MPKIYRCADCGNECQQPIHLQVMLTQCGVLRVKRDRPRRHLTVALGHYCREKCAPSRVRRIVGREVDFSALGHHQ